MKKHKLLLLYALVCFVLLSGCSVNITRDNAAEDINDSSLSLDGYITADGARAILQNWIDNHPFQLGAEIEPDEYLTSGEVQGEDYTFNGSEYYRFYLSIIRLGVAEILVHKETGNIFHLKSPYSSIGFGLIDDWYNKDHADINEGFDGAGKDVLEMSDDELTDYVIRNAPEVNERMNMRGGGNLKLIVIENIREDIPNESKCREVWLVWDIGGDDYDIMIIYAVGGSGAVYQYDPDAGWTWVDPQFNPYE